MKPGAAQPAYADADQTERVSRGSTNYATSPLGLAATSVGEYFTRGSDGAPIGYRTGGNNYYFLYDGLGSTVAVFDSSGTVVHTYNYSPFGSYSSGGTGPGAPFKFAGGYYDASPVYFLKFGTRYYNPDFGRWTQQDPVGGAIEDPQGADAYLYVGDDPINFTDPSGMCWSRFCWASHAYRAVSGYLEHHRWARCTLFAASALTVAGSYGLAIREAVTAAREGRAVLRAVAFGTSTRAGTTGGLGVLAEELTGGCFR